MSIRNPAVKRILQEVKELREPTSQYHAQPIEDDLFEWHFTIRGPSSTPYEKGVYHGRILLPTQYPFKPPSIIWLTPNGRFEVDSKICLSISDYHPEYWRPSWSIRTVLLALISYMPADGGVSIGALSYPDKERVKLAIKSLNWKCKTCDEENHTILKQVSESNTEKEIEASKSDLEAIQMISFSAPLNNNNKPEKESNKKETTCKPCSSSSSTSTCSNNNNSTTSNSSNDINSKVSHDSIDDCVFHNLNTPNPADAATNLTNTNPESSVKEHTTTTTTSTITASEDSCSDQTVEPQPIHNNNDNNNHSQLGRQKRQIVFMHQQESAGEVGLTMLIWVVFVMLCGMIVKVAQEKEMFS